MLCRDIKKTLPAARATGSVAVISNTRQPPHIKQSDWVVLLYLRLH